MQPSHTDQEAQRLHWKFKHLIAKYKDKNVSCPLCYSTMKLCEFPSHTLTVHQINPKCKCCYCMGQFTWAYGEGTRLSRVISHRIDCLNQFLQPKDNVCIVCFNSLRYGFTQSMDGHVKNPEWKHFYEPFYDESHFNLNHGAKHVKFTKESGLGSVMYDIFKKFNSNKYFFYHVMVRAKIYDKFLELIDKTKVYGLPYQCLCASGHGDEEALQHHKHIILMVEKDYDIGNVWRKIKMGDGVKIKLKKQITTLHHLMNVIFYVSSPYATCDGSVNKIKTTSVVGSHYWINRQLYHHAKIAMGCLFLDGHKYLIDDSAKNKNVEPFYQHVRRFDRKWHIEIQHLNLKPRKCIIPFEKPYELTSPFLYTGPLVYIYDSVMELAPNDELLNMDFESWYSYQLENDNIFLDSILSKLHPLQLNQVKTMNQLKKVDDSWKEKYDMKVSEYDMKVSEYENKISEYEKKIRE